MSSLIALETSSSHLSLALKREAQPLLKRKIKGNFRHSEKLIPTLDRMLQSSKLSLKKVGAFLIGLGPGSFTGLRVGFSTLKGLLASNALPCYGASSLDLIAFGADLPLHANLAVLVDGGREKIYFRLYTKTKSGWRPGGKAAAFSSSEIAEKLSDNTYLAGDALHRYREAIEAAAPHKKIHYLPEQKWYPSARSLVEMFESRSPFLKKLVTPKDFTPLYLRLSEAEERRKVHAC